jgi:uncharacterized RDD family membrane protein YckC
MLDTVRQVETPEGIQLSLPVAGPVIRARAWVFDMMIRAVLMLLGGIVFTMLGNAGVGLYLIYVFGLSWLYPVLFEVLRAGRTPGKQIAGLRVIHDDGMPVGWSASMIRSLIGFVDMLPVGYAAGLVCSILNRDSKRLGDLAAGTVVVHTSRPLPAGAPPGVAPMRPPVPLRVEEQHTLVEFAARAGRLTHERLRELAQVAAPLTAGSSGPAEGVRRLLAQARWISGDR